MRRPTLAALLCRCAAGPAGRRARGRRARPIELHPRAGGKTPLAPLAPAAKTTLAFHAPHGYVFTVEHGRRGRHARRRRPAAVPGGRASGASTRSRRPRCGAQLQQAGQLVDVTVDAVRPTRVLQADETAPEPLLPAPVHVRRRRHRRASSRRRAATRTASWSSTPASTSRTRTSRTGRACCWRTRRRCARPSTASGTAPPSPRPSRAARNNIGMAGLYPTVRLGMWDGGGDGILTSETLRALRRAAPAPLPRRQHVVRRRGLHAARAARVVPRLRQRPAHRRRRGQREPAGQPGRVPGAVPARADGRRRGRPARSTPTSPTARTPTTSRRPGVNVVGAVPQALQPRRGSSRTATRPRSGAPSTARASRRPSPAPPRRGCGRRRPDLEITQVFDLVRFSARDVGPKGFDRGTGFGVINVKRALARKAPRVDPMEPNDDIILVDGRLTGKAAKLLLPIGVQSEGHPRAARLHRGPARRLPRGAAQGRPPARHRPPAGRRRRPGGVAVRRRARSGLIAGTGRQARRARSLRARRLQARHASSSRRRAPARTTSTSAATGATTSCCSACRAA